jgi:outer membrane protein, protease secretion system
MKRMFAAVCVFLQALPAGAEVPRLSFTMSQVIDATFTQSPELRAAELNATAAEEASKAEKGRLYPQLFVDGSARRVTEIPTLTLPTGPSLSLTDHESYSIGPTAQYTLFKGGADYYGWKSAKSRARSRRMQEQVIRRQQKLAARLAYFQAQLAAEQVRLLVESYRIENQQYQDIRSRYAAGSASRTDLLQSHQQTLQRRRQLLDARADMAIALREITRLTGLAVEGDVSLPMDGKLSGALPRELEAPTVLLDIAAAEDTLRELSALAESTFDKEQPGIQFLTDLAEAAEWAAKSSQGSRWPELSVLGRTSWDYPNGPIRETIHQNTIGATLNLPLFTGGQLFYNARAKKNEAKAAAKNRDAQARDLLANWQKAHDQLTALRAQQSLNETAIKEAQELARLQYQSYRAGRARYLDVEDANFRVVQARSDAAETDVRILVQLANLESLSVQKE